MPGHLRLVPCPPDHVAETMRAFVAEADRALSILDDLEQAARELDDAEAGAGISLARRFVLDARARMGGRQC